MTVGFVGDGRGRNVKGREGRTSPTGKLLSRSAATCACQRARLGSAEGTDGKPAQTFTSSLEASKPLTYGCDTSLASRSFRTFGEPRSRGEDMVDDDEPSLRRRHQTTTTTTTTTRGAQKG